ncbi:putative major sperm protein (MSP) [Helianthus annuus]|uniref:Major sperm protein (MSP) n=1 Tax=Helianthus annuus TaxID=4232 RepID=A0A251T500_HELAN|nr:vesicle-associated protein 2-2 isoform X2 [Helianthus annuus]KAF5779276.1 putative major sperm protein (MSP) [Helianthus annuus]KAJ0494816.1 putative major sperm protein (MSP) [Helianthus annuus]KAJ0864007.1 putative major sperm protein (MSP) [Helianthus annuus]
MKPEILEVQAQQLKFIFELKKQSSCSVQMINKTNHHVAFKIKTTNPKKYCVRPNAGVIDPNASCEFSVTMQAPKVAPPDMISKDKFLIQSTVVPEGTEEEDVTSNMFVKADGKIVDEKKLKVILIPPPESPINEPLKLVDSNASREVKDDINTSPAKVAESLEVPSESLEVTRKIEEPVKPKMEESSKRKDAARKIEEHVKPEMEESSKRKDAARKIEEPVKPKMEESSKRKDAERKIEEPSQVYAKRNEEFVQIDNTEELKLAEDVEAIRSKVKELESKLTEAKATILHLTEEKRSVAQEKHFLQGELDLVRSKRHRAQVGFPLLYVFMVGLVSLYLGYLFSCTPN